MNHDDFVNDIKKIVGDARQDAYKTGFTDGINFIKSSLHLKEAAHLQKPTKIEDFWDGDEDL
jgi:hypothetical protein